MTLANIQRQAQSGNLIEAANDLRDFLSNLFPLEIEKVEIREDRLSLNSVNGFIHLSKLDKKTGEKSLFFKFHHEENEEGLKEYYNSKLLTEYGFPVEMPVYVSQEVGKQVLIYQVKTAERMADICKRSEAGDAGIESAQANLDKLSVEKYIETLHIATPEDVKQETIMQLFYNRLVEGRYEQFYVAKNFEFPGDVNIVFEDLRKLKWCINGIEYKQTLGDAFDTALNILSPAAHGNYPAVVAHGDAHNGNVWYNSGKTPYLTLFDPAFAGRNIPALLAEIKTTFHNIFAHPLWLYDSQEADKNLDVKVKISSGVIDVTHNWELSVLRKSFLEAKKQYLWKPLLAALDKKGQLPADWEQYMRSALFCCPTLVMNLRANAGNARNYHTPKTSLLGLSISMMLSSAPVNGKDVVSEFFGDLK